MICIISGLFEAPQVRLHGLFAVGAVLLSLEGGLVGGDLAQVVSTGVDRDRDRCEALTLLQFVCRRSGRAGDGAQTTQVDAGAALAGCLGYAVGSEHHLLVSRVGRFLVDLGECTADGFDHVSIFGFCHVLPAMFYLRQA